jgi:hypothetical protein
MPVSDRERDQVNVAGWSGGNLGRMEELERAIKVSYPSSGSKRATRLA